MSKPFPAARYDTWKTEPPELCETCDVELTPREAHAGFCEDCWPPENDGD